MKKISALISTVLFALTLAPMAALAAEDLVSIGEETRGALELLRGLDFIGTIPLEMTSKDEARDYAPRIMSTFGPTEAELDSRRIEWEFLGLIPPGYDLKGKIKGFAADRTRAFYDAEARRILLTENAETPGWNTPLIRKTMETLVVREPEYILAHEYSYALLDGKYRIDNLLSERLRNGDRRTAALALVNGDALLVTMEYLIRNYGVGVLFLPSPENVILQFLPVVTYIEKAKLSEVPKVVADTISFPLVSGVAFATQLRKTGGMGLLNSAYTSPPLSTEQIMHPEKYFEKRDNPIEISFPDLSKIIEGGASAVSDNVLGEWGLRETLTEWLGSRSEADSAAAGWGGDRFVIYQQTDGNRIGALYTTWDTGEDAKMFEGILKRAARKKFGDKMNVETQVIGRDVIALFGADKNESKQITDLLWQATQSPMVVPPPTPEKADAENILSYQQTFVDMFGNLTPPPPPPGIDWQVDGDKFTNGKYNYSVVRPNANWQYQRLHLGNQFISEFTANNTKELGSNFTIFTFNKYGPEDTDNPVDEMVVFMSNQMKNFKVVKEWKWTVGGFPARSVTFSGFAIIPMKITYTEIFAKEYTYVVTWWSVSANYDKLEPEYKKFMDTFKVMEN